MKKIIILSAIVALLVGCTIENKPKKELKGYRFKKEYAVSDSVKSRNLTKDLTIDMYVMLHEYKNSWTNMISKKASDSKCEFCFRFKGSNNGQFYFGNGSRTEILSYNPEELFELNKWQRVTLVRDMKKRELRIYVNGDIKGKKRFPSHIKASALTGNPIYVATKRGDMTVGDVKIWNKTMPDSDILKGWSEIENPKSEKSLVAYWTFEDIDNKQVECLVDNELDLTIKK